MLFENSDVDKAMKYHGEERFEEGREEGRKEGRKEGLAEGRKNTAFALKKEGMSVSAISRATKLSVSTIRRLFAQRS